MILEYEERTAEVLKALGHPARLMIARGLLKKQCNVTKIVAGLNLPQPTVSQHLKILKNAGVIKGQRKGVKVCYQVEDPVVKKILSCL